MTDWIAANKGLINSKLNDWGDKLAGWVNSIEWQQVADQAVSFAKAFGDVPWGGIAKSIGLLATNLDNVALAIAGIVGIKGIKMTADAVRSLSGFTGAGSKPTAQGPKAGRAVLLPAMMRAIRAGSIPAMVLAPTAAANGEYNGAPVASHDDLLDDLNWLKERRDEELNSRPRMQVRPTPEEQVMGQFVAPRSSEQQMREAGRRTPAVTDEQAERIGAILARNLRAAMDGVLNVGVTVAVDGPGKVAATESRNTSGLVGRVKTNLPGYTAGEGMI